MAPVPGAEPPTSGTVTGNEGASACDQEKIRPKRRCDVASDASADVTYVGFVIGHGGDALQMLALACGMQGSGARVRVIVPATAESITFQERCKGLGIDCVRSPLITADLHGSRQRFRDILRLLRSVNAPVVHFHTGNSCLPRKAMLALTLLRFRPVYVTVHSPYETITPGSNRARFWAFAARRRFSAVVSPSDHGTRFQVRCGVPPRLTRTIRNSIDVSAMASGDGAAARAALGVDGDVPVVLFSSRLDGQKRPVDAVQAFTAVADDFPTAVLVFVGGGEEEAAVTAAAAESGVTDRIRMVGYRTNVADWLASSTVWILPTERENFSVAVLEALAAGCAVLSTDCPGNDEVLVDGVNARLFHAGDVAAAAAGLRELLGDKQLRSRLAFEAGTSAKAFSAQHMVDEYRTLYAEHGVALKTVRA